MRYWMKGIVVFLVALLGMPSLVGAYDADGVAMIHKPLVLPGGKKGDPLTLYYPIELTSPGEINVLVRVDGIDPSPATGDFEPLRAVIVDSRAFKEMEPGEWKQFCREVNRYNPLEWIAGDEIRGFVKGVKGLFGERGKPPAYFHGQIGCGRKGQSESMKHAVDSPELSKTQGRYVVIIRNMEPSRVNGVILIAYPGAVWDFDPAVMKSAEVHPDLVVEDAAINGGGMLEVKLANRGKGVLHKGYWHLEREKAVTLSARVAGRNHVVTLQAFDPNRKLERSGGTVTYTFEQVRNIGPARVSVTIDPDDMVFEENENNNTLTPPLGVLKPVLTGTPRGAGKPDLAVTAVRLNAAGVIEVEIRNTGGGLDGSIFTGANTPYLNLKMNGNGWSNVHLGMLDPGRNLSKAGGIVVYSTGYVLRQNAEITATIDAGNLVDEVDENNNTLKVMLLP